MSDLETVRRRWLEERPKWGAFGEEIAKRLKEAIQKEGIWCVPSSRAKEPHSLIKKLLKGKYTYNNLPDRVGVRCVVRYLSEAEAVVTLACQLFDCSQVDRKIEKLEESRVGYAGIHMEIRLRQVDPSVVNYPPGQYWVELQIQTLGQHSWSEMTHDSVYKNDDTLAKLPVDIKRRVNLMAGLIEVADREFDRVNKEMPGNTSIDLYKTLERHYFRISARRPDPEISLEVIDLLAPLYGGLSIHEIKTRLSSFFAQHEDVLHSVYAGAEEATASAFLYQPEVLMIYERLETDQLAMRKVWNTRFPEKELELIANSFGISFD